jgi:predicted O-methyltransferase YrrM
MSLDKVPKSSRTGIPGWETEAEEERLIELASEVRKGGTIVELGCEYGRSTANFLIGSHQTVAVISVDIFPTDHPEVGDLLETYQANVTPFVQDRRIGLMHGDSHEASKHWNAGGIDLLFIDADHSYEAVKRDIEGWVPHVRVGGFVAFHDCAINMHSHPLHFEVSKAVDEWKSRAEVTEFQQVDSLRVFRKDG